jgi:O-acetylserine/cysteine efflux transporter
MARHPSSTVAPFSMLVPVVGIGSSWLLLGDATNVPELVLGAVVLVGVLLGSGGGRRAPSSVPLPLPAAAR